MLTLLAYLTPETNPIGKQFIDITRDGSPYTFFEKIRDKIVIQYGGESSKITVPVMGHYNDIEVVKNEGNREQT